MLLVYKCHCIEEVPHIYKSSLSTTYIVNRLLEGLASHGRGRGREVGGQLLCVVLAGVLCQD